MTNNETLAIENFIKFCDDMMIAQERNMLGEIIACVAYKAYLDIKAVLKKIFNIFCKLVNKFRNVSDVIISKDAMKIIDRIEKENQEYLDMNVNTGEHTDNWINSLFIQLKEIDDNVNQVGSNNDITYPDF